MKKLLAVVCLGVVTLVPVLASAAEDEGRVRAINSWSITLENGNFFTTDKAAKPANLKVGDSVKVTYVDMGDDQFATKIESGTSK